jgi:hypothetical protein
MSQARRVRVIEPALEDVMQNFVGMTDEYKRCYDLLYWVEQGKLGWLNPQILDLEFGPDKTLPTIYQHIKGRPYFMNWFGGRLRTN